MEIGALIFLGIVIITIGITEAIEHKKGKREAEQRKQQAINHLRFYRLQKELKEPPK